MKYFTQEEVRQDLKALVAKSNGITVAKKFKALQSEISTAYRGYISKRLLKGLGYKKIQMYIRAK